MTLLNNQPDKGVAFQVNNIEHDDEPKGDDQLALVTRNLNKFDQIKKRFNDESSHGIRCLECGSRGHIQSEYADVLKKNKSYNTSLGDDRISSSPLDSDTEEQENDAHFLSQISCEKSLSMWQFY